MVAFLFNTLKRRHPAMYEALGQPHGFEPRTTQALLMFLLSRRPESLADKGIRRLANVMRAVMPVYLVGFMVLFYLMATSPHSR